MTSGGAPDVLIVGGGVIALTLAERFVREGASVRVVEADQVGAGASGAAAGMLAPLGEAQLESAAGRALFRLGLTSLDLFESLCLRLRDETGIDPEYEASGRLEWATTDAEFARISSQQGALLAALQAMPNGAREGARRVERCDPEALSTFGLGATPIHQGGVYSPSEAHLRPPLFVRALAQAARAGGARIESGTRVQRMSVEGDRVLGVETSAGRISAGCTIVAAGVATPEILGRDFCRRGGVAIEPVRGQILSLLAPLPAMKTIAWAGGVYFVPKRDGSWVIGATEERVGFDRRVTAAGTAWLLSRAIAAMPDLAEASFGEAWAGLRPVSLDRRPYVGAIPGQEGLIVASGHGRNGVLLAPVTAQIVCDRVQGKAVSADAATLEPEPTRGGSELEANRVRPADGE